VQQGYNSNAVTDVSCSATWSSGSSKTTVSTTYTLHVETSSPTASATASRPPDANGWYNGPVTVSFAGSSFSGIASCTSPTTYSGPDSTGATVSGICRDNAGKSVSASTSFPYEQSSPTISVGLSRPADSNGWYNHPVTVSFGGSSFSGIASCTSPTTYSGPYSTGATMSGSCTDNAGKTVSATSVAFRYLSSAPLLSASSQAGDGTVFLQWAISDLTSAGIKIIRTPGYGRNGARTVYQGTGASYRDTRVRNGVTYRYALSATDQAGNTTTRIFAVSPGPRLLAPTRGGTVTGPPMLLWTPVRRASYYNIQLFRGGKEILSAWPTNSSIQLHTSWQFNGRRYRLIPGRYRWYVWPGFGQRRATRYGPEVGSSVFVVARGS
jgi:hypothetical protein